MAHLIFLGICSVWGASFILMNRAGLAFSPLAVGGWRVASGAAVLALLLTMRGEWARLTWKQLGLMAGISLIAYAWPYSMQPFLINQHDHGFIGMIVVLVPLLTMLFSIPVLGVWPSTRQLVGVTGGLCFMGLIMFDGSQRGIPWQHLLIAASVPTSYAFGNTLIKKYLSDVSPLLLTTVMLSIVAAVLLPLSQWQTVTSSLGLSPPQGEVPWGIAIFSLAILGLLGTGLSMYMFNYLVVSEGPLFAGMVTYIVPFGAIIWSWLDNGNVTTLQLIALVGTLSMVIIVQTGAVTRRESPSARLQTADCME